MSISVFAIKAKHIIYTLFFAKSKPFLQKGFLSKIFTTTLTLLISICFCNYSTVQPFTNPSNTKSHNKLHINTLYMYGKKDYTNYTRDYI